MGNGASDTNSNGFPSSVRRNSKPHSQASNADDCQICLSATKAKGGVAIMSPGCCGKFFHQKCVYEMIVKGNTHCPNCRTEFAADLITAARAAAPVFQVQQQQVQQQQMQQLPHAPQQQQVFQTPIAPPQLAFGYGGPSLLNSSPPLSSRSSSKKLSADLSEEDMLPDPEVASLTEAVACASICEKSVAPESAAAEAEAEAGAAVAGAGSEGPLITISAIPEMNMITLPAVSKFYVNVNIKASDVASASSASAPARMPMDVCCVLDNSGSMDGSKLESVKVAMKFVRSQLHATDRLSVVSFNSSAELVHGLLRMDAAKKEQAEVACGRISAGGGTAIYAGMKMASDILNARKTRNSLSCVFLLTDGQDSSQLPEKKALAEAMRSQGVVLSVFGFGADHDAQQLETIANAAEGSFTYVEDDDCVTDAFGGAIGGAQGTIATQMTVSLEVPTEAAAGITLKSCNAGRYACNCQSNGSYTVTYANLYAGEQRDIVVVLTLPESRAAVANYPLLTARATYKSVDGQECHAVPLGSISASASASSSSSSASVDTAVAVCAVSRAVKADTSAANTNMAVNVQINRFKALQAMKRAMTAADNGNYTESRALLNKAISEIKATPSYAAKNAIVMSSVDDLEEALTNTRDDYAYSSAGGKATMCSNFTSHSTQRTTYNKASKAFNPYQTQMSSLSQTCAYSYKTSMN